MLFNKTNITNILKTNNKVLVLLTLSDVFTWAPFSIISSLAGIYLAGKLGENVVQFVGIGTAIYYVTKGILQLPVGALTDKIKKDRDEIVLLFIGTILMGLPYIFYPLIEYPFHYYILQFIFGIGTSLSLISWRKLFALNIKNGREGINYAKYETLMSTSAAVMGVLIGYIANLGDKYFDFVMLFSGITMMLAGVWVALIYSIKNRQSNN